MTAEIAIMNKSAIALAADSAVSSGAKIYNSVNKVFMLSKYEPIGIMVYDNASFMGIPWETIIKLYREKLDNKNKCIMYDYAYDFIKFIKKEFMGKKEDQRRYFTEIIIAKFYETLNLLNFGRYVSDIVTKIDEKHGRSYLGDAEDRMSLIFQFILEEEYEKLIKEVSRKWGDMPHIPKRYVEVIFEEYDDIIKNEISELSEVISLTDGSKQLLRDIAANSFYENVSGIVIAGFGKKELFPAIFTYIIAGAVDNKLKYMQNSKETSSIDFDKSADIIPFAQHEMVDAFTRGVTPLYHEYSEDYLKKILDDYPTKILEIIDEIDDKSTHKSTITEVRKKMEEIKEWRDNLIDDYNNNMEDKKEENYTDILNAVMALPKDEMALMAESLVHITSLKRKFTYREVENVGGAIDVAIISKGDGFVWFKRKHYFDPELNHHFFKNYYNPGKICDPKKLL